MSLRLPIFVVLAAALFTNSVSADNLRLSISGKQVDLEGEILLEGQDKSLYFLENNGKIWFVKPNQIIKKSDVEKESPSATKKEIGKQLLKELPAGFRIYQTKHYVIAYQTELAYAKWVASLYESRLYRAFEIFWEKKQRVKIKDPEFPLVAIVFGSKSQYEQYVQRELGSGQSMVAYYNLQNNRVAMFDLTSEHGNGNGNLNERRIEQILRAPGAENMVATMIHEATHQLIFNRGLQTRFADSPLWLNEGLAMYFEAPNKESERGWQRPGMIFRQRLDRFRQYGQTRPADSLVTLISSSDRLQKQETAIDAYAESWALVHFLINRRSKKFAAYMKHLATKKALEQDTPQQRLDDFKKFFGDDLADLEKDFFSYVRKLR